MGTALPAFPQSNVCARQTEPGRRHAVMEQRLLRRVDSPSASGSGNMGDLWQGRGWPLRLKRQLSLPDILFEGQGWVGRRLTQPPPLCISPNRSDPSGHQTNQRTQTQSYFSSGGTSIGSQSCLSCSPQPPGPFPWDGTFSLRWTARSGIPSPSCGLCTFGHSMGARPQGTEAV